MLRRLSDEGWLRRSTIMPTLLAAAFIAVFTAGFYLTGVYDIESGEVTSSSTPQRLWATLAMFTGGYISLNDRWDPMPPVAMSIVGILALSLTLITAGSLLLLSRRVQDFVHLLRPKARLVVVGDGVTAAALIKSAILNKTPTVLITDTRSSVAALATKPSIPIIASGDIRSVLSTPTTRRIVDRTEHLVLATDSDSLNMELHEKLDQMRSTRTARSSMPQDLVVIHDWHYAELVRPGHIRETLPSNEVTCPAENIAEHICHLVVAAATGRRKLRSVAVSVVEVPPTARADQAEPGLAEAIQVWLHRLVWSLGFVRDDKGNPVPTVELVSDEYTPQPGELLIQVFTGASASSVAAAALPTRTTPTLRIAVANRHLVAGAMHLRYRTNADVKAMTGRDWLAADARLGDDADALDRVLLVVDPDEIGLDAALITDDTGTQWARTFDLAYKLMFNDGWSETAWQPGAPMGESTRKEVNAAVQQALSPKSIAAAENAAQEAGEKWDEAAWRSSALAAAARKARKAIGNRYSSRYAVADMLTVLSRCGFQLERHESTTPPEAPRLTRNLVAYIAQHEHHSWLERTWYDTSGHAWQKAEQISISALSSVRAHHYCYAGLVALETPSGWERAQELAAQQGAEALDPKLVRTADYNRRIATETYPAIAASFGYSVVPITGRTPEPQPQQFTCRSPLCPCHL